MVSQLCTNLLEIFTSKKKKRTKEQQNPHKQQQNTREDREKEDNTDNVSKSHFEIKTAIRHKLTLKKQTILGIWLLNK